LAPAQSTIFPARIAFPFCRIDRLPVVMRVKGNRPLCPGRGEIAHHDRGRVIEPEETGGEPALLQDCLNRIGVPLNSRRIARQVGKGEQLGEFPQNGPFMFLAPLPRFLHDRAGISRAEGANRHQPAEQNRAEGATVHFLVSRDNGG
jgi:hypothetical protein